jgi:hypothetical protein
LGEPGVDAMTLDIHAIATKINRLAPAHPIGKLQDIRKELKGFARRPGTDIFSAQTSFDDYAFHLGGRKELQFNIGYVDDNEPYKLRFGVAFSFETNQTLPSIDVLVPKVKFFNDFIQLNADDFADMRMWHYDGNRSADYMPGPISSDLVVPNVFVFLGGRLPASKIDYQKILDDFDRLLPLYKYVEAEGRSSPVPFQKGGFTFKPGCSKKATSAKVSIAKKELDLDLRHGVLQDALSQKLVAKYGKQNVRTEQPSGVGTLIDIVVQQEKDFWFYEIKTALTARACLREAIGQLLEYSFWPGAQEPTRYIVVGESPLDKEGEEYLRRLKKRFALLIEYQQIVA